MRCTPLATIALIAALPTAALAQADPWWRHVAALADDSMRGRQTGSPEHRKAASYVAAQLARYGVTPGAAGKWTQPVRFRSRRIDESRSSLALVRHGAAEPLELGPDATISMRVDNAPALEAPLVFLGWGLTVPEAKHDDLAGIDVRGKVVVLLAGGPPSIPAPLLAHSQRVRWEALRRAGAVGIISISNPRAMDIPWERSMAARLQPSMALADSALSETRGQRLAVTFNPARAEKLFAGSGRTFAQMLALADSGKALPRFALPASIRARVAVETAPVESENVVGILPGSDPALAKEYVVISAHLDHLGVGAPVGGAGGDSIFNGAMDNASGIATLIETARALKESGRRLRRSVIFLAVTGEEKGLLGSRYFAHRPTVPRASVVANVNADMPLPLFPLTSVIAQGLEESSLGADLRVAAGALGLRVLADPEALRNAFIRSDQYSFILAGVPAI